ncbi:MAG TPA: NUDIX hydrolase [Verrucomicrobiae bacterium]|nr:NUDIX hydrolase [Verrucomicrobiae bacterium]
MTQLKKWHITKSRYIVNDRWLKLRADDCLTADGHKIAPYYVVEHPEWANCFVIDDQMQVLLVNHYRHGIGEYLPELVSGGIDASDSSPLAGITRELKEELGYVGGEVHPIGASYPNSASHTNRVHSFIAFGGGCQQPQQLENGEDLEIIKMPFKDFATMIQDPTSGTYQSMHLATIFFAFQFIKKSSLPELQEIKKLL